MRLKLDSRTPVYIQVIQYFKEQIASGALGLGEEIPSRRELASQLKINPNTVQRAYKEMEEAGLIFTEGNMPSRITRDEHVLNKVRDELIMEAVQTFIQSIRAIDVTLDEALRLIEQNFHGNEGKDDD